ncbi:MAG: Inner-membrane translocator [Bacillota bacterium]|nr:MAG: Inner-membrane translocator [Bacillota bacterium]
MQIFFQNVIGGIEAGSMYALAALGLVLIYRTAKMSNFAQGTIGMFNAYIAYFVLARTNLPLPAVAILSVIVAFVVGALIELVIMRRASSTIPMGKPIMTLGLIIIFQGLAPMIFGPVPFQFPRFVQKPALDIAGVKMLPNTLVIISVTIILVAILFYVLQNTRLGLAVRVTAANETTARLMGVPTRAVSLGAWSVATALGALSAIMVAPLTSVTVTMMETIHLNSFIAAILGGFSTFHGPVVGAFILGVANNIISYYISSKWVVAILYTCILAFTIFKPQGLFGKAFVKKV